MYRLFSALAICFVVSLLFVTDYCRAQDAGTHSAYKVTTYSFGNIMDFEGATSIDLKDYHSLLITNSVSDILSVDFRKDSIAEGSSSDMVKSFVLSARFDATQQISLQGAVGIAKNPLMNVSLLEQKSSWEANLGLIYQLFPNLNYEIHFGYMDTGDLFKERADFSNVDSIIMISNKLTMSF